MKFHSPNCFSIVWGQGNAQLMPHVRPDRPSADYLCDVASALRMRTVMQFAAITICSLAYPWWNWMHFLRIQWAIERKPVLNAGFTKSLCSLFLWPKNALHQSKSNFKAKLTGNFTSFSFGLVVWVASENLGVGRAIDGELCVVVAFYEPPGNMERYFGDNVLRLGSTVRERKSKEPKGFIPPPPR